MSLARFIVVFGSVAALAACGGDVGDGRIGGHGSGTTPVTFAAGGLYVGYVQEDPAIDTADPQASAFSLAVPTVNGAVTGAVVSKVLACQGADFESVTGTRSDLGVSGSFNGTVDNVVQSGTFTGTLDTTALSYAGTYANVAVNQAIDFSPCTKYTLAASGSLELFPVSTSYPSSFTVKLTGRTVSWPPTTSTAFTLVYLLDPAAAQGTANPVLWQALPGVVLSADIPATVTLTTGKTYLAVVELSDAAHKRLAFSSLSFNF